MRLRRDTATGGAEPGSRPGAAGSVVLVTGASSGIGRATALALGRLGATVVAAGRNAAALDQVSAATGGRAEAGDLTQEGEPARLVAAVLARYGRLDVLVNNAGIGASGALGDLTGGDVARLVATNLTAPLALVAAALPGMLERRQGHIVNVASIVGFTGNREETAYSATKAGLVGFTRSLRQELAGRGVSVSLVVPGVIDTPFFATRGSPYTRSWPRPLPAERVASVIVAVLADGRPEVFVPAWMRLPAELAAAAPRLYERLANRFG